MWLCLFAAFACSTLGRARGGVTDLVAVRASLAIAGILAVAAHVAEHEIIVICTYMTDKTERERLSQF